MAKSTKHSGPSFTEDELSDVERPYVIKRAMLGGEGPSVGSNSEASTESESDPKSLPNRSPQQPAQTTENPFSQTVPGDSAVRMTDGDTRETEQQQSDKRGKKSRARKLTTTKDIDEFD